MADIIREIQDLRRLDWAEKKLSPGTPGCFLKACDQINSARIYYKLSNYDSYRGIYGHECVNEIVVCRSYLLNGLNEILAPVHLEKIWEMIWKRWCCYETLCNQG